MLAATSNVDQDNFNELQRAYNACMAETDIQKLGIEPIQSLLGDLTKVLTADDSTEDSSQISETILYLEKTGIPNLLNLGIGADDKDPVSDFLALHRA